MLLYILLLLPSADPALAQSKAEKIAALDAEQTFREAEEAAAGLIAKDLDSPTEFNYSRHPVEGRLGEYCDSMRRYSSIRKECERIRKLTLPPLLEHRRLPVFVKRLLPLRHAFLQTRLA